MAKPKFHPNPRLHAIFDDLEQYLEFCRTHGYVYNEADLYNWKSYAFQQYNKMQQKKTVKNMWEIDSRPGR